MDIFNTRADPIQLCIYEPGDRIYAFSLYPGGVARGPLAPGATLNWNPGGRSSVQIIFWVAGTRIGPATFNTGAVTVDDAGGISNTPPNPASARDAIRHVVVLMLENRSFDNILGWLYADTGNRPPANFPPKPTPTYDGLSPNAFWNTIPAAAHDSPGGQKVFAAQGVTGSTWWREPNPNANEEYPSFLEQMFGTETPGAVADMSGFLTNYAKSDPTNPGRIMECFTPQQLPVLSQLARAYAVCDRWFCSLPSETWPNRSFVHAGTSFGRLNNGDQLFEGHDPVPNLSFFGGRKTVFDVLDAHHIPWKVYHDSLLAPSLMSTQFWTLAQKLQYAAASFTDFERDAAAGALPAYSFIEPEFILNANDQHPGPGCDMRRGEDLIFRTWQAVSQGPGWLNTLLLITYDEHGGCYDHVPPPATAVPPDGSTPQFDIPGFNPFQQFGPRVPMVVVSPWVDAGVVFRTPGGQEFDHTSVLATLRDWLFTPARGFAGVPADWLSSNRVAVAPTVWPVLNRAGPRADKPVIQRNLPPPNPMSLGGGDVTAVSRSANLMDIFMVDAGGTVRSAAWAPTSADGWHGGWAIGAERFPAGAPVNVSSRATDLLDAFATDISGVVRTAAWAPTSPDGWHGWSEVAGGRSVPGAAVTSVSRAPNNLDIFVVGADGGVRTAGWDAAVSGAWRGWTQVGTAMGIAGAPVHAVSRSTDHIDLFMADATGAVLTAAWQPAFTDGWHGWWTLAGLRAAQGAAVTAVSRAPDKLDIFVVGPDGRVWTTGWEPQTPGGWRAWSPIGAATFPPGAAIHAVSRSLDHIDIFGVDVAGVVRSAAWQPAFTDGWHGWFEIAGGRARPGAPVHAAVRAPDLLDLFITGLDGGAWSAAWSPATTGWGGWWKIL